jgi:hypothetical protein
MAGGKHRGVVTMACLFMVAAVIWVAIFALYINWFNP